MASSTQEATLGLLNNLMKEFALKDLGELHYFLGIEVKYKMVSFSVKSQDTYASDFVQKGKQGRMQTS